MHHLKSLKMYWAICSKSNDFHFGLGHIASWLLDGNNMKYCTNSQHQEQEQQQQQQQQNTHWSLLVDVSQLNLME